MRHAKLFAGLLLGTATLTPAFAWAVPNCGNPPLKTAEVVYTIQTPEQIAPARVETFQPVQQPVQVQPVRTQPVQIAPVIAAPAAVAPAAPIVTPPPVARAETFQTAQVAAPAVSGPAAAYASVLQRRISRGAGGLNLFDYGGAKAAGEGAIIKTYTDHLASQNPDSLSQNDQIAYWANLYNALTVNLILDN